MADRKAYDIYAPILGEGHARSLKALGGAIAILAADLALNNTVGLFKAPKGFTLVDAFGFPTDMDTNGAPTLLITIGDSGSANRFLTSSNAAQSGAALAALATTGRGYKFTADTEIVLTVTAAAATAAAGTLTYFMVGFMDKG